MKTIIYSLFVLFAFGSCGNDATSDATATDTVATSPTATGSTEMPAAVSEPWGAAIAAYLRVKEALVAGDTGAAQSAASQMASAIGTADMGAMGASHDLWMSTAAPLAAAAQEVSSASDLEAARTSFSEMSAPLVAAVKVLGTGGQELYLQHCPMAFDNAGADWVSATREIRNPYFGDAMLTCGRTTEEL